MANHIRGQPGQQRRWNTDPVQRTEGSEQVLPAKPSGNGRGRRYLRKTDEEASVAAGQETTDVPLQETLHLGNYQEGQPERVPTLLGMPAPQVRVLPVASGAACLGRQATGCGRRVPTSDLGARLYPSRTFIHPRADEDRKQCNRMQGKVQDLQGHNLRRGDRQSRRQPTGSGTAPQTENQTKGNSSSQGQLGPSPKRAPQWTKEEENLNWDLYWKEYREWLGKNQTHSHSWPYQPVKKEPTIPAPTTRHFRDI